MKKLYHTLAIAALTALTGCTGHGAGSLRCEYLENPTGIDEQAPRFSWTVDRSGQPFVVEVAESPEKLAAGELLWQSEELPATTLSATYGGPALQSHKKYA